MDSIPVNFLASQSSINDLSWKIRGCFEPGETPKHVVEKLPDAVRAWLFAQDKAYYFGAIKTYPKDTPAPLAETRLDRLRFGMERFITSEYAGEMEINVGLCRDFTEGFLVCAQGYVWAEAESVQRQEVKYPADWWEAWKLRFAHKLPKWVQRRLAPVKYTTVSLDVKAVYPTFKPAMQNERARLVIQKVER